MPTLFVFSLSAEMKLSHRMKEVSRETEHSHAAVKWAEEEHYNKMLDQQTSRLDVMSKEQHHIHGNAGIIQKDLVDKAMEDMGEEETEKQLMELYRRSIRESGVNIVPGDTLQFHHRVANYISENPFKILLAGAIPCVGYIFYGRTDKQHLNVAMKIMHTRVFGQFATISLLLGVMGFKEFMDKNGKYITQAEAEARVEEMRMMRQNLQEHLQYKRQQKLTLQEELRKAQEKDMKDTTMNDTNANANVVEKISKKKNKKKKKREKKKSSSQGDKENQSLQAA